MPEPRIFISIQTADFDAGVELTRLRAGDAQAGAACCFVGAVRDHHADSAGAGVLALELEHYPGMTERAITAMADQALHRFALRGARVIHRIGRLAPSEQIVLVAVTAMHRGAAFQGCEFLMDYLKTQAPFWKKEITPNGARWVDARADDDAALARWGIAARNV
ncbi:MAG: molybdenum cofactor biosynthesis protein MoaE [Burkholderiaceae bacterium]|jgi:molybdopterin synthase catalytic subunit|nr:molybdenum cofactor biosynthesis protein MoaE [Burkholderiaceae bacterium]